MTSIHIAVGASVLVLSLAAGGWGGWCWYKQIASQRFWYLLRFQQGSVALQALIGASLLSFGEDAGNGLHYLYGGLPLVVTLLAEGARAGAADLELAGMDFEALPPEDQRAVAMAIVRRETGIMAISCVVVFFLALRAAGTSPLF
jgi:heme A synthase